MTVRRVWLMVLVLGLTGSLGAALANPEYPARRGTSLFTSSRNTISAIRFWSTALYAFLEDNPGFTGSTGPFISASELRDHLVPEYILPETKLTTTDGWSNELLFWIENEHFAIMSFGSDGMPDQPYRSMESLASNIGQGAILSASSDIVLLDSRFVSFPKGSAP